MVSSRQAVRNQNGQCLTDEVVGGGFSFFFLVHRISGSVLGAARGSHVETAVVRSKLEPPQTQFSDGHRMSNMERGERMRCAAQSPELF